MPQRNRTGAENCDSMTRVLLIAGLFIAGALFGVVLTPAVSGGWTGLTQQFQTPLVSGKHTRADGVSVVMPTFSEQNSAGPVMLNSVKESELGEALASIGLSPERE